MPQDGLADANDESNIEIATKQLTREARQALSFGGRGVKDVTEEFAAASQQLPTGQLVKDEYFTLFEAVGALEIMDSKMDSGYVPPGDSFEPEFDPCRGLEATEIIWVMDQLLCLEIEWLEGCPLSQTLFTSLHVDRLISPDNRPPYTFDYGEDWPRSQSQQMFLVHSVLRAYCIALVKCCELALHLIQSQNFYEEEDLVTHLFGRELLHETSANEALDLLSEASSWLDGSNLSDELRLAISGRFMFRRFYLQSLAEGENRWAELIDLLKCINDSHDLRCPLPDAFSYKIQRQLATSTPPRPVLQLSWIDAQRKWLKLCADVVEACKLTDLRIVQSPHCLQRATWAFAYREPQPNTFARAYLQNLLFSSDRILETVSHYDLLLTDIRELVLAGDPLADSESFQVEVPSDPRHQCSRVIETFMDKMFDEYLNFYRMVCQNRCRVRRTFTQAIPILDGLESEAKRTDEELHNISPQMTITNKKGVAVRSNPMTSWMKYYRLRVMTWTVQLGFETDIYLPDELCMMYWLVSVLSHSRCTLLQHIDAFLTERMKNTPRNRSPRYAAEWLSSSDWLTSLNALAEITRMMSLALWRLCTILMAANVIKAPKRDFAEDQLLYEARMRPYLTVTNDPIPSLQDFRRAQKHVKSVEASCNSIDLDVKDARVQLAEVKKMTPQQAKYVGTEEQWKREMKQLETTCVAIAVVASQLLRICEKHGRKTAGPGDDLSHLIEVTVPAPGKRYHDWWVVPQLKEKKLD